VWAREHAQPSSTDDLPPRWFLKPDLTGIIFDVSAQVTVRGIPIPGASASLTNSASVSGDIGYFPTSNIALDVGFGYPPKTTLHGVGALSFIGVGATSRYAPVAALVQYHPNDFAPIRPYVGVGLAYSMFFDVQSKSIQSAHIRDAWGIAFQGGLDYDISRFWGGNFEIIKIYSSTMANGGIAGTPATANVHATA
jgi:outer membrane protein